MPSQDPRDRKADDSDKTSDKLEDLQQPDMNEKDASQVKGGDLLNPQPLPPRHIPGVVQ